MANTALDYSRFRGLANQYRSTTGKKLPDALTKQLFTAELDAQQGRALQAAELEEDKRQFDENQQRLKDEADREADKSKISGALNTAGLALNIYGAGRNWGWWGGGGSGAGAGSSSLGAGSGAGAGAGSSSLGAGSGAGAEAGAGLSSLGSGVNTRAVQPTTGTGGSSGGGSGMSSLGWTALIAAAVIADNTLYQNLTDKHSYDEGTVDDATRGILSGGLTRGQMASADALFGEGTNDNLREIFDPTAWFTDGTGEGAITGISGEMERFFDTVGLSPSSDYFPV